MLSILHKSFGAAARMVQGLRSVLSRESCWDVHGSLESEVARLLSGILLYILGFWAPIMLPLSPKRICFCPRCCSTAEDTALLNQLQVPGQHCLNAWVSPEDLSGIFFWAVYCRPWPKTIRNPKRNSLRL